MALALADNPIRLVYAAIWDMLEDKYEFTSLVEEGNRIKYTGSKLAPDKDTVSTASLPQVRVIATGLEPHIRRTTSGSSLNIIWEIQIASGDQRFATVFDVSWAIYRAMTGWADHIMTLEYGGETFVTLARPLKVKTELGSPEADRGIKGWSSVWAGEVQLWFNTTLLTAGT
jgi:hypothetical protein